MCKRLIINAGIESIIIRNDNRNNIEKEQGLELYKHDFDNYTEFNVKYFILHDDSKEEDSYGKK